MAAERLSRLHVAGGFCLAALACLPFADLGLAGVDPWDALARMGAGLLRPDFSAVEDIFRATALTVGFALAGVTIGGMAGLVLAPFYHLRAVRIPAIALRSVHELFWALFLIAAIGLGPMAGVLAIALPYAGIFAKVFAEQIEEADPRPAAWLGPRADALTRFLWTRAPLALRPMWSYWLYRFECGMRASAVLGFVGLPTLGFQLDAFFKVGNYGAVSAVMMVYVILIATIRLWMRPRLVPLWIAAAFALLATIPVPPMGQGAILRALNDMTPAPIRGGDWAGLIPWLGDRLGDEILPGLASTLVAGQIALALTGLIAFLAFGLVVREVAGRAGRAGADLVLILLRSFPEYMLAYLFLQVFGPSMLPAVLALALHNGAIIAHLTGREAAGVTRGLRADAPRGLTLWGWELVPRLFGPFLALCLYRWEIILRETAVMGLLGVATLGFYVDTAMQQLRLDRALVLLIACGLMTAGVDALSRAIRARLRSPARHDIKPDTC
ncbi:ABC transporter permease [Mangrovicoccus sp. HB182678]|uniref:ABC transporter permease n=2 Tax=Mangrovicoccus algicola TaxID=2771008 RepID=A0A8J7CG65_9RHOB|nr:ABC transporter permease [Mangrovicoccus algicola]